MAAAVPSALAAKDELPIDDGLTRRKPAKTLPANNEPKVEGDATNVEDVDDDADEDDMAPEARPTFERTEIEKEDVKYRDDAVHVYGLDFLKTEHMNEIFGQFQHRFIEWINDSCANIVFRNKGSAKKALESLSYPKVGDAPWRRTPDILVNDDCPPIFLQMRLATRDDVKKGKRAIPVMSVADSPLMPRDRSARGDGPFRPYRDGMTTELLEQAGLLGRKRNAEPLTNEEQQKRQKREKRFGEKSAAVTTPVTVTIPQMDRDETSSGGAREAEPGPIKQNAVPLTEEEVARRKKRSDRFSKSTDASASKGVAETKVVTIGGSADKDASSADTAAKPAATS